jgi:hypothetical protein
MDLSLDEVLTGRTLGRITPIKEGEAVVGIDIHLVGREHYQLLPKNNTEITDVFINTAHRAVPIAYISKAPHAEPMFWSLKIGAPSWVMAEILYLPGNPLRPLDCFDIKRVGR